MKACASMLAAVAATAVLVVAPVMVATAAAGRSTGSAVLFKAPLSGAAEVPAAPSSATGVAMALFSDARHLSVAWSFSGLPAPVDLTAGIHLCQAPAGAVGPALMPLTADVTLLAGGTGGCGWSYLALNATTTKALFAGNLYMNIFIKGSPRGGLRGQLRAVLNGAAADEGEVVVGPSEGPGDGFFGEDDDVVGSPVLEVPEASTEVLPEASTVAGFPAEDAPEASALATFPAEDVPEASVDVAESDNDKDTLVGPSDGPTGAGDEEADFELEASTPADFPAVGNPQASEPAAEFDGDEDALVGPSYGPETVDDTTVGFPAVEEPEESKLPASDGDFVGFGSGNTNELPATPTASPNVIATPTPYVVRVE
ncbi:hypothetical protein MMPV_002930 [Pyropia vietnamensis]